MNTCYDSQQPQTLLPPQTATPTHLEEAREMESICLLTKVIGGFRGLVISSCGDFPFNIANFSPLVVDPGMDCFAEFEGQLSSECSKRNARWSGVYHLPVLSFPEKKELTIAIFAKIVRLTLNSE